MICYAIEFKTGLLRLTAWRLYKQVVKEKHKGRKLLALGLRLSFTGNDYRTSCREKRKPLGRPNQLRRVELTSMTSEPLSDRVPCALAILAAVFFGVFAS